ncbi:P-loop containing nucleoside triphosphate hydrolase [Pseudocohnilembus persalinus]|uniref:Dynein light intermediate chain n=1 Tax=Pseudocohnilembus persalinus TaxID=266149 RepID=A0A0V0QFZ5_PSEPJ|nr:P-loop containing nucleoside triphosphate hydrolase [Pseudocohnilembus persalinus]|eukprot:KRX01134.1 P-loop containing nucleoside triphosphate hydrolase [Pseudocohnilembus persalinus]
MTQNKQENLWNTILSETQNQETFSDKNIIILGRENVGKRSLLDQLHEISQTEFFKSNKNDTNPGKLRIKGQTSALNYVYLNVKNQEEQDDQTNAKIGIHILDDPEQQQLLKQIINQKLLENSVLVIMLDLNQPGDFIEQINKWLDVFTESKQGVEMSINQLDEMKVKVENLYKTYKQPTEVKTKESNGNLEEEETQQESENNNVKLPLPEGVLLSNFGIPIIIAVNKSDLLENMEQKKQEFLQYSMRQLCLKYGAGLVYNSAKSNYNLDVFYEYILHILYNFDLKHKPEVVNQENTFIPIGYDNPNLLKQNIQHRLKNVLNLLNIIRQTFPEVDQNMQYTEIFPQCTKQQQTTQEYTVQDDNEFFQQLRNKFGSDKKPMNNLGSTELTSSFTNQSSLTNSTASGQENSKKQDLNQFYQKLLVQSKNQNQNQDQRNKDLDQKKKDLQEKFKVSTGTKTDYTSSQKIKELINRNKPQNDN